MSDKSVHLPKCRNLCIFVIFTGTIYYSVSFIIYSTMGKGDQRSKRGKIYAGSHGKTRPKQKKLIAAKKKALAAA
jgi:ribosomal small subunit protein bTHX